LNTLPQNGLYKLYAPILLNIEPVQGPLYDSVRTSAGWLFDFTKLFIMWPAKSSP